jgi:hypothetical protein
MYIDGGRGIDTDCESAPRDTRALNLLLHRHIDRPKAGEVLYTDYYGATAGAEERCSYYGRSWTHVPK